MGGWFTSTCACWCTCCNSPSRFPQPCKLFAYGKGKCPFGNSCFYAHLIPNQQTGGYEVAPPEVIRTRVGAEGETSVVGETKISDFFR